MKKIYIILLITVVSVFMIANFVAADGKRWRTIRGTYKMIATGSCLHSPSGFKETIDPLGNPLFEPNDDEGVWGATTSAEGTWVFYSDGSGQADIWNYPIDFPPGSPAWVPGPRARSQHLTFDTTYEIKRDKITIYLFIPDSDPPVKVGKIEGWISLDKKTLTIPTHLQYINFRGAPLYEVVCNTTRVFIRVQRIREDD